MNCKECKYYEDVTAAEGRCRKSPPQTIPIPREQSRILGQANQQFGLHIISYWPQVNGETDFCGEFLRK